MSNADWYARRLGQPAPQQRGSTPPAAPPAQRYQAPAAPRPDVQVTAANVAEAAALWQGGEGIRTETENCPQCGSDLYFSRANGTGEAGGSGGRVYTQAGIATVAARCFSCGFSPTMPMQGAK